MTAKKLRLLGVFLLCKLTLREVFPSVAKAEQIVILGRMSSVMSFKKLGFLSALKEMNSGLQGNNSLCYLNANQVKSVLLLDEIAKFSWELYCGVRGVSREMLNRTG